MSTFCVLIQDTLIVSTCPLRQGRCYWQHAQTNICKYSQLDADSLTVEEFCQRTGRDLPTDSERVELIEQIRASFS